MPKQYLFAVFLGILLSSAAAAQTYKVYVIHSYLPGLWSKQAHQGIVNSLKFHGINDFQIKQYDYNYVLQRKNKLRHVTSIQSEIALFQPNLILVFDDEAAEDFIPTLNRLNIPIVATGINQEINKLKWYLPEGSPERNFTAILERYPFEAPLKLLKKIRPEIEKITILTTDNDSSNIITNQLVKKFEEYGGGYAGIKLAEVIQSRDWGVWKEAIKKKKHLNEAFWILVPWDVYEMGKEVPIKEIGRFYQSESSIPELGIVNASQLLGMLLCFSVNSEDLAFEAVSTAIKAERNKEKLGQKPFEKVRSVRVIINKKRSDQLKYKIPSELLDFAKIEKKIPLEYLR